jgi:hypothetical protein
MKNRAIDALSSSAAVEGAHLRIGGAVLVPLQVLAVHDDRAVLVRLMLLPVIIIPFVFLDLLSTYPWCRPRRMAAPPTA